MEDQCHAQCTAQVTGHETDAMRGNGSPETGGSDGIRESKEETSGTTIFSLTKCDDRDKV